MYTTHIFRLLESRHMAKSIDRESPHPRPYSCPKSSHWLMANVALLEMFRLCSEINLICPYILIMKCEKNTFTFKEHYQHYHLCSFFCILYWFLKLLCKPHFLSCSHCYWLFKEPWYYAVAAVKTFMCNVNTNQNHV